MITCVSLFVCSSFSWHCLHFFLPESAPETNQAVDRAVSIEMTSAQNARPSPVIGTGPESVSFLVSGATAGLAPALAPVPEGVSPSHSATMTTPPPSVPVVAPAASSSASSSTGPRLRYCSFIIDHYSTILEADSTSPALFGFRSFLVLFF